MTVLISLGWIGVMLCVGMVFRAKVTLLKKILAPTALIAGIVGFTLLNTTGLPGSDFKMYSNIVTELFTISFISIGLTKPAATSEGSIGKAILKGSLGMGLVWDILYALTPVIGALILFVIGPLFDMDPVYGLLVPFAFAQGPGQAAAFGATFESFGWVGAADVGVCFASIGFIWAFVVGAPLARLGYARGLTCLKRAETPALSKGYFTSEEKRVSTGTQTVHIANIDPLAFHMALTGLTYVLTWGVTFGLSKLIGEDTLWNMMFITGLLCAYIVRFLMKKLKLDFLHDNGTQRRITGFATDFLVTASFMSVQMSVIGKWLIPILIVSLVIGAVTYFVCVYFGRRFGGKNDFERTLGLWGVATGTVPSGIALVRIVDPELETTTAAELGMMNIPMMFSAATMIVVPMVAAGTMSMFTAILIMLAQIPVFLVILRLIRCWGKPTYSLANASKQVNMKAEE